MSPKRFSLNKYLTSRQGIARVSTLVHAAGSVSSTPTLLVLLQPEARCYCYRTAKINDALFLITGPG
jgi:hypothetical protein